MNLHTLSFPNSARNYAKKVEPPRSNPETSMTLNLPSHLRVSTEGHLQDMRRPDKYSAPPLRSHYQYHWSRTDTLAKVKATLRAGPYVWPGGYPLYFITRDGGALCFDCVRKEFRQIVWDFLHNCSTGWRVEACDNNYEDNSLICDHCNKQIPSAYGE